MWWDCADKEWEGLDDRKCFEHGLSKAELKKRGISKRIIGLRYVFENKLDAKKDFVKAKGRCVAQGHSGALTKGVDYQTVFAPAPSLSSPRLIQAMTVLFGWTNPKWH